jgi:hypothetical protein
VRRRIEPATPESPVVKCANPMRRQPSKPGRVVAPLARYASHSPVSPARSLGFLGGGARRRCSDDWRRSRRALARCSQREPEAAHVVTGSEHDGIGESASRECAITAASASALAE